MPTPDVGKKHLSKSNIQNKNSQHTKNKGEFLLPSKEHLCKSTANIALNRARLNAFLLILGIREKYLLSTFLFNIIIDILAMQKKKRNKRDSLEKEK